MTLPYPDPIFREAGASMVELDAPLFGGLLEETAFNPTGWWVHFDKVLPPWRVSVRMIERDGQPIVGGLLVLLPPFRNEPSPMPQPGLGSEIRGIRLGDLSSKAAKLLRSLASIDGDLRNDFIFEVDLDFDELDEAFRGGREAGRPVRRDDCWHANIAAAYVALVAQGERAVHQTLGLKLNYSVHTVRDAVKEARRRGLLNPPVGQGRAGGSLTAKARLLLDQQQKEEG